MRAATLAAGVDDDKPTLSQWVRSCAPSHLIHPSARRPPARPSGGAWRRREQSARVLTPRPRVSLGISRDSRHKRSASGAKRAHYRKKRKFELGRQPAMTKLSTEKRIHLVRVRGGNIKHRALRLESGNFSWGSETITRKTRLVDVVYNASNNELVRTKTLVKGAIVQIDATPFRQWYEAHYGKALGKRRTPKAGAVEAEEVKTVSARSAQKHAERAEMAKVDSHLDDQFSTGRLYAMITSRPGQSGRADGMILEGKELEFYIKKIKSKK